MKYILASKSPRRREILQNIGLKFDIITADTDESCSVCSPAALVEELAVRKGRAVEEILRKEGRLSEDDIIISADTVVECCGEILGKPKDAKDAERMLNMLSGREHRVWSGAALIRGGEAFVSHSETVVCFDDIPAEEIAEYIALGEPFDKAGAYGIQGGHASLWVKEIRGCYFGVVGLSLNTLDKLHKKCTGRSLI